MNGTTTEGPIQLPLEEPEAVLEVLLDTMMQFERERTLFRRPHEVDSNGKPLTKKQNLDDFELFKGVHKAMDKYSLSAYVQDGLLSRLAKFLRASPSSSYHEVAVEALSMASRARHRELIQAALVHFRDQVEAGTVANRRALFQSWVYTRPDVWTRATVQKLGLPSYHLLVRAMCTSALSGLDPTRNTEYWDHVINYVVKSSIS